jgi:hypothetical protein
MEPTPDIFETVARAIQLALAPVFLLTGIAGILNVMTGRLSRIIDRGRALLADRSGGLPAEHTSVARELEILERRRYFVSVAITSCTIAVLLVCMVIAALFLDVVLEAPLFLDYVLNVPLEYSIAPLFTLSMAALVVGLSYFLREVHIAMLTIHLKTKPKE